MSAPGRWLVRRGWSGWWRRPPPVCRLWLTNGPIQSIEGMTVPADGMNSDIHGSAEYRAHLIAVMAKRAVAEALGGGGP